MDDDQIINRISWTILAFMLASTITLPAYIFTGDLMRSLALGVIVTVAVATFSFFADKYED